MWLLWSLLQHGETNSGHLSLLGRCVRLVDLALDEVSERCASTKESTRVRSSSGLGSECGWYRYHHYRKLFRKLLCNCREQAGRLNGSNT